MSEPEFDYRYDIIDIEQGTEAWRQCRLGRVTASVASHILAKSRTKGEESAMRRNLRVRLALERITGESQESEFSQYGNSDTRRGVEFEPRGYRAYEHATGEWLSKAGFFSMRKIMAGLSPDGIVGDPFAPEGLIECKVPRPANHLVIAESPEDAIPSEYAAQLTHALYVSGAAWIDLVSFCPQFQPAKRLVIRRLRRESVDLAAYEGVLLAFLDEVDKKVEAINGK